MIPFSFSDQNLKNNDFFLTGADESTFFFPLFLCFLCFFIFFLLWQFIHMIRQIRIMRTILSLSSHMLQSRLGGLKIFLKTLEKCVKIDSEITKTALITSDELHLTNQRLEAIARSSWVSDMVPFGSLVKEIQAQHENVELVMNECAKNIKIPVFQFQLIIDELIRNAQNAKNFISPSPKILLEIQIEHSFLRKWLSIVVNDNGTGMTSDIIDKVEKPFFSTRGKSHLGLGLTCCKEMIFAMSGKLDITSLQGEGTRVKICYPLYGRLGHYRLRRNHLFELICSCLV